ncbi:MAG: DUF1566 domain-containing protein [Candidatus Eisenbacteria bacterium]|nr:DUF1566 domain-containing protein [Candidatus Eisenbacteria bacterium]
MRARIIIAAIALAAAALVHVHITGSPPGASAGMWGDVNADERIDIGDAMYLLQYIFASGPEPVEPCRSPAPTPRFQNNGDGTVTDHERGLMWVRDPRFGAEREPTMTWSDAMLYCQALDFAGYDDWRAPTVEELVSTIDYRLYNSYGGRFPEPVFALSWTKQSAGDTPEAPIAWAVETPMGNVYLRQKTMVSAVRPVRDISACVP